MPFPDLYRRFVVKCFAEPHPDMPGNFLLEYELYKDLYCNRDGYHQNQAANKIYADYFYNQWKLKNESQNTQ